MIDAISPQPAAPGGSAGAPGGALAPDGLFAALIAGFAVPSIQAAPGGDAEITQPASPLSLLASAKPADEPGSEVSAATPPAAPPLSPFAPATPGLPAAGTAPPDVAPPAKAATPANAPLQDAAPGELAALAQPVKAEGPPSRLKPPVPPPPPGEGDGAVPAPQDLGPAAAANAATTDAIEPPPPDAPAKATPHASVLAAPPPVLPRDAGAPAPTGTIADETGTTDQPGSGEPSGARKGVAGRLDPPPTDAPKPKTEQAAGSAQRPLPVAPTPVAAAPDPQPGRPADPLPSGVDPVATPASSPGAQPHAILTATAAADASRHAPPPPPAEQLVVQVTRAVQDGVDRLTVELKPETLGRISVRIEVMHDHRIVAAVAVDRQETLDLLQKDARVLERALQDSGLKADSNSLSFSLREQGGHGAGQTPSDASDALGEGAEDGAPPAELPAAIQTWRISATGIDIQI